MVIISKTYAKKLRQKFYPLILLLFLYSSIGATVAMGNNNNTVNIEGGFMNADLDSVPLLTVLQNINMNNKLKYKVDDDVLNEKITLHFNNLSVEDGLKRILRKFNYTITYNSDEKPAYIYIYGKRGENKGNSISDLVGMASLPIESPEDNVENQIPSGEQKEPRQFTVKTGELNGALKVIKIPRPSGLHDDAGAPRRY